MDGLKRQLSEHILLIALVVTHVPSNVSAHTRRDNDVPAGSFTTLERNASRASKLGTPLHSYWMWTIRVYVGDPLFEVLQMCESSIVINCPKSVFFLKASP